jgi:hypothetical protein
MAADRFGDSGHDQLTLYVLEVAQRVGGSGFDALLNRAYKLLTKRTVVFHSRDIDVLSRGSHKEKFEVTKTARKG